MSDSVLAKLQCVHAVPANQLCHQCGPEVWNKTQRELPAKPYRYLTSEQAELLPLPLQLERLREINEELVSTHNHMVIQGAKDDRESAALREQIAKLTLLSDSQLANQERLVGEMQELRQVVKEYRECKFNIPHKKSCKFMAHHDCRCDICIKADALLAKDTPTEPKSAPEDTK